MITLFSVWAVIATVSAVDIENQRRKLFAEHIFLESNYEDKEEAYDKLKTKYDELKAENEELEDKYIRGLAFEVLWDMGAKSNSAEVSLDRIAEREGLTFSERTKVSTAMWEIIDEYELEK